MSQTLDQSMFSISFHNHVESIGGGRKDQLIQSISQKIYEKHKAVISLKKVQQFTESQLKGKQNIDSSDLTKIENKIVKAMEAGIQSKGVRINGRNSQINNQPVQGFSTVNMRSPAHTNVNSKSVLEKYSNNLQERFNTEKKQSLDLKGPDPKQRSSAHRLPSINSNNQNSRSKAQLETIFGIKKNLLDKSLERMETDPGNQNLHLANKLQHEKINQLNRVNNLIQARRKTHSVLENTQQLNVNGRLKPIDTGSGSLSPKAKNPLDKLNNSALEGGVPQNMNDLTTVLNLSKMAKRQGSLWDAIHEERAAEEHKLIELREMKRRQNTLKMAQANLELTEKKINLKFKQSLQVQDEKKQILSRMKEHQDQEWSKYTQSKQKQHHLNSVYKQSMDESKNNLMLQRKQMSKDLHQSIRKKEQFDAQRRLDRMRKQRIQTEMAALWLEEKEKKQLEFEAQHQLDRSKGITHVKNQNLVFDRNQEIYAKKINDKIRQQNSILSNTLSPDNKYKNYSMALHQKDQELEQYLEREKNKSQKMAEIHEINRKKFRKDQSKMLKEQTLKQIDQQQNDLQKQRQDELEEGIKIVENDLKIQKTQELERKLKKKQGQQQYKKDLITQVYSKVNLMQENIDDKEFATSKKYGQNGAISQVGSGFNSLSGTVGSPSPLLKRDNNN